jgi:ribose 5-phosphate isomerase A
VTGPDLDSEKKLAADAAAELIEDGMKVGLGTGSTVAHLLPAIAARRLDDLRCVATSVATEEHAKALGIPVEPFERLERLDIAVDGADQIAPDRWLVKGGGGAHTREKIVASSAELFVVIADSSKTVERIEAPIPLELASFGLASTLARVSAELGEVELRPDTPPSPDGGLIADYGGEVGDPAELAGRLASIPGVVDHGLFTATMVSEVLIGRGDGVKALGAGPVEGSDLDKLKRLYERWGRGDFSRSNEFMQDDIEMRSYGFGETMEATGTDEIAARLRKWLGAWERPLIIETDDFEAAGDRILVLVNWKGRGKESGVEMDASGAHIWTFQGGLAVGFDIYRDRDQARAAFEEPT